MVESSVSGTGNQQVRYKARGFIADFFVRLLRDKPLGSIGGGIFLILLITGIFANFLAPYGYNEMNPVDRLKPPSCN